MESTTAPRLNPFTFVASVTENKEYIFTDDAEKEYSPFVINRALSNQADCLFMANQMNQYPDIPKRSQYEFYLHSLEKKKRYGKWVKADKNADVELVKEAFGYSRDKAERALEILTEEQIIELRNRNGGKSSTKSK